MNLLSIAFFQDLQDNFILGLNMCVEVACWIEIILNSLRYNDDQGDEILDPSEIWKHYLKKGSYTC